MSMEINNTYNNYLTTANNNSTNKTNATNETKPYINAKEYSEALSKKYECVRDGSVAISGAYLSQCANDPEKAKELEENLSLFKDIYNHGYESAKRNAASFGGKVTNYSMSWNIDSKGEITMISSTTVVTDDGRKSWKEVQEEMAERSKEKKEEAEKLEKKTAEKKDQTEQLEKIREKNSEEDKNTQTYEVKVVGNDVLSISNKMEEAVSRAMESADSMSETVGIDIKV